MLVEKHESWYNRRNELPEVTAVPAMMNVHRVAELAKIALTPGEETRLSAEMADILSFARQLELLDLQGVEQTQHILDITNVLRADAVRPCLSQETLLSAAPARVDAYIAVPRTVE